MLKNVQLKPISGTFISPLFGDTGINNWGRVNWEKNFKLMKAIGIDTVIVIRCEMEIGGKNISALDPRSTTWPEDPNLLSMFFRLANENNMKLFLGGPISISNLHKGEWRKEVDNTKRFYEKMLSRFGNEPCFYGLYNTLEALPWHFNFFDILLETTKFMKNIAPDKKTLLSPSFNGITGNMSSRYSAKEWCDIYGEYFFEPIKGLLDYCAPQDTFSMPECEMGEMKRSALCDYYQAAKALFERNGIELWSNIETFQRDYLGNDRAGFFRQCDYRTLYMKLETASQFAEKLVTFEFTSCMSPDSEWGASGRLLERYLEMCNISIPTNMEEKNEKN